MNIKSDMGEINYYKNFNMGRELETAGEFIYGSIREIYSLKSFNEHFKINQILYYGSVGIERLQKILLSMYLLNSKDDVNFPPEVLLEHKHIALNDKIKASTGLSALNKNHVNMLYLFQEYYKNHRYGEFKLNYDSDRLAELFAKYFQNITNKDYLSDYICNPSDIKNIKKLYINYLGVIAREYFKLIRSKSNELGIFTTELTTLSNAIKVFYVLDDETLYDYIQLESIALKELIIYLSKFGAKADIKKITRHIKKLKFDPAMINEYLIDITNFKASDQLTDMVYEFYTEMDSKKLKQKRKEIVDLIGCSTVILD